MSNKLKNVQTTLNKLKGVNENIDKVKKLTDEIGIKNQKINKVFDVKNNTIKNIERAGNIVKSIF